MAGGGRGGRRRGATDEDDLDITPMIDVTFLLLIFFMVTSTMEDPAALQIPPAKHGEGISTRNSSIVTIFAGDDDPEVYLTDGTKEGAPVSMAEVTEHVLRGIGEGKRNVIIKADREVPSGFVEEVARAANDADAGGGGTEDGLKFYVGVVDRPQR